VSLSPSRYRVITHVNGGGQNEGQIELDGSKRDEIDIDGDGDGKQSKKEELIGI
jgi:hypothetical protein